MPTSLQQRFADLYRNRPSNLAGTLTLARGSIGDYQALSEHHYKAGRPSTVMRVLVLRHNLATVTQRFLDLYRGGEASSSAGSAGRVVAVLVESQPSLSCRLRDWALDGRYRSLRSSRQRASLLSAELRTISRVVVAPQWRGLGLAVRLVREALATATTPYTEAIAAMGKVHPFFEKAGMTPYHRPPLASDNRLVAALGRVGIEPVDLALLGAMFEKIESLPDPTRQWLLKELNQWHHRKFIRSCYRSDDPRQQLRDAQRQLLAEPVYYLHDNRCGGQGEGLLPM